MLTPTEVLADLRSDTVTKPDAAMRAAIAEAEVGDHTLGDDPTAAELESYAAELLGKEAALFFPSGIMANQTGILVSSRPGTEVLLDESAHIVQFEEAAAAAWAGVQLRGVATTDGILRTDVVAGLLRRSRYVPEVSLICLENTHNTRGGRVYPLAEMAAVSEMARAAGIRVHLDGARLPNAAIAVGIEMREWARHADTVMISLSKGLGAPVGSLLAGDAPTMEAAWRVRRRLGGGMRQAGLLAAAGLYALRNNLARLAEDHRRARELVDGLSGLDGITPAPVETNIVMVDVAASQGSAQEVVERLERRGIRTVAFGPARIRMIVHKDVDDAGIAATVRAFRNFR